MVKAAQRVALHVTDRMLSARELNKAFAKPARTLARDASDIHLSKCVVAQACEQSLEHGVESHDTEAAA
jgi:hypothetical protein